MRPEHKTFLYFSLSKGSLVGNRAKRNYTCRREKRADHRVGRNTASFARSIFFSPFFPRRLPRTQTSLRCSQHGNGAQRNQGARSFPWCLERRVLLVSSRLLSFAFVQMRRAWGGCSHLRASSSPGRFFSQNTHPAKIG